VSLPIIAQNPYESIGKKEKVVGISEGKYIEFFKNEDIVQIGSTLMNVKTGKIVSFLPKDSTYQMPQANASGRFFAIDPLAEKYYNISPYAYVMNNPIKYFDPDGRVVVDANGNIVVTSKNDGVRIPSSIETRTFEKNGKFYEVEQIAVYENVFIYADDGTPISATMLVDSYERTTTYGEDGIPTTERTGEGIDETKYNCTTNCHGLTFANGEIRIGDDDVPNLLRGDRYKDTKEKRADAVIFHAKTDGKLNHSAQRNADGTYNSNDGDDITLNNTSLNTARRGPNTDSNKDRFVKKKRPNRVMNTNLGKVNQGKRIIRNQSQINAFLKQLNNK
jgi:hypothetical protein